MKITFDNIVPTPLEQQVEHSEIWGKYLELSPDSHYSILAPSGKGKSTFVHVLYGLRKDYSGELIWGDQPFSELDWQAVQKIRSTTFGIIFQDLRLFPKLTPLENINLYNEGKTADLKRVDSMAEALNISALLSKKTSLLSYGQMQRVAILRTLSRPFKWLIMDEPFSHLDGDNKTAAMNLIQEVVEENGATMVLMGLDKVPSNYKGQKSYRL